MTSEEDFQKGLDAQPDNHHLRLVFADWLDEQGDPRGAGYRALGMLKRIPVRSASTRSWRWWDENSTAVPHGSDDVPRDWLDQMDSEELYCLYKVWDSRQEAEDAAAIAFLKLPVERQAELLSQQVLS